ncbi:MAG: GldG family protein [Anaerolineae bacterium]|nr:GldG family protein [Anaerolineae bacterium]
MKTNLTKFAPWGLYLAGIAFLVTICLMVVFQSFDLPAQISLGVAVLGFIAAIILDPQKAREIVTGRQTRYASNALLFTVATLGILILINYFAFRTGQRWDLTQDKTFSLTQDTINVLNSLPQPVKVEAYFTAQSNTASAKRLLDTFKFYGKDKFDYEFIDPNSNIVRAQNAKITRDATLVFVMGEQQEQVTYISEEEFTSALLRLANPGKRVVYFLSGHGEPSIKNDGDTSLYQLTVALQGKNYTVNSLNLLSDHKIPDDALALIVADPQKPLTTEEVDLVKAYLENGGGLVYLSEPPFLSETPVQDNPLETYLKDTWGINQRNNIIIDPGVNPPIVTYSKSYGQHSITSKLGGYAVFFPTAHSVSAAAPAPTGVTLTPLIFTSENTWGETNVQNIDQNVTFDASTDLAGPVSVAVAGEDQKTNAKIVVIGDSDFARDKLFAQYGNSDFIVNSIDWASKQDNLLNLTPKNQTTRTLIPPQQLTIGLIALGVIIVLPGLIIAMGISTWIQRRNRG